MAMFVLTNYLFIRSQRDERGAGLQQGRSQAGGGGGEAGATLPHPGG